MTMGLWTYQQVAEYLGVPVGTVYAWVSQRRIPFIRISGRCVRFDPEAINAWLDSNRSEPRPKIPIEG